METVHLTPAQVQDVMDATGLTAAEKRICVISVDPAGGEAVLQVFEDSDTTVICGPDMYLANYAVHRTGTIQATIKRRS